MVEKRESGKKTPTRWALFLGVGIPLFVAILGGLGFYLAIWPWIEPPPVSVAIVDARWKQVEHWASYEGSCSAKMIRRAAVANGARADLYQPLFADKTTFPRLDEARLAPETREALRAFGAWADARGGIDARANDGIGLELYRLGRIALATSTELGDPRVAQVLHASRALRRCGTLFDSMTGFALATAIVHWTKARHLRADARFEAARPTRDEIFAALAREAVRNCELGRAPGALGTRMLAPFYLMPFIDSKRELWWMKYDASELLFRANSAGRDPVRMAALYTRSEDSLPKSVLVRAIFFPFGRQILKVGGSVREYDAMLDAR